MGIPTEAAKLASPPTGDGNVLGRASAPSGGDGTFEGAVKADLYDLTVVDLKSRTQPNPYKNGKPEAKLVWLFSIVGQEEKGLLALYTSFSIHEKSGLLPVLAALGANTPEDGAEMKRSDYIGKTCKGFVEMVKSKNSEAVYPRITKLVKA